MLEDDKALAVVERVTSSFSKKSRPTPEEVEAVMRPFAPISADIERQIQSLLTQRGLSLIETRIGSWLEANDVVSGTGPEVEARIQFLLMDTCTCVLDHLEAAITHATKPVDPRVLNLLNHPYYKK